LDHQKSNYPYLLIKFIQFNKFFEFFYFFILKTWVLDPFKIETQQDFLKKVIIGK